MAIVKAIIKETGEPVTIINSQDEGKEKTHQVLTKYGLRSFSVQSIEIKRIEPSVPTKLTTQQRFKSN